MKKIDIYSNKLKSLAFDDELHGIYWNAQYIYDYEDEKYWMIWSNIYSSVPILRKGKPSSIVTFLKTKDSESQEEISKTSFVSNLKTGEFAIVKGIVSAGRAKKYSVSVLNRETGLECWPQDTIKEIEFEEFLAKFLEVSKQK